MANIDSLNINGAYSFPKFKATSGHYLRGDGKWALMAENGDGVIGNEITAVTNATLVHSAAPPNSITLNLANSNTWTALQTLNAGANFPVSGTWNGSGNIGINNTAPFSRLSVNGNATIGASYATIAAPANGLFVQGLVSVNSTTLNKAQLYSYWAPSSTIIKNIQGEAFTTQDGWGALGVSGGVDYPSVSNSIIRSSIVGALAGDVDGAGKHTVAEGHLSLYDGTSTLQGWKPSAAHFDMIAGVYGHIYDEQPAWGSVAKDAKRVAILAYSHNMTEPTPPEDYGLYALGPRHYLEGTLNHWGNPTKTTGSLWLQFSDRSLKNIGGTFDRGLAEILALNPVRYHYKTNNAMHLPTDKELCGLIAQEVDKVIPEAVVRNENGYLGLVYDPIMLSLVNALKELNAKNEDMQAQLKNMQTR